MSVLELYKEDDGLYMVYTPEQNNLDWLRYKLSKTGDTYLLKKTFLLCKENAVFDNTIQNVEFKIADNIRNNGESYFLLDKKVFDISFNFYLAEECNVTEKWFIGARNTSVLRIMERIGVSEDFFVGGKKSEAVSEREYKKMIKSLPTATELNKYVTSRLCSELRNFVGIKHDSESEFHKYLRQRNEMLSNGDVSENDYADFNLKRYESVLMNLKLMLRDENAYELRWEKEIVKIIQVLYPKYVVCKEQVSIKSSKKTPLRIDLLLGDADGNIDVVEIKRPHKMSLLTKTNSYRDNYVPLRELSGTIMQCEKYIYHMTRNAAETEERLNLKFKKTLPRNYSFRIVNPKALIIMGRDVSDSQKLDFEIVKRKYKNVIDIITYDDLLRRLQTSIDFFKQNAVVRNSHENARNNKQEMS